MAREIKESIAPMQGGVDVYAKFQQAFTGYVKQCSMMPWKMETTSWSFPTEVQSEIALKFFFNHCTRTFYSKLPEECIVSLNNMAEICVSFK